ncbi:MAG: hypothetical protein PHS49_03145 [Candidatus Gracilibacteria bacterium]|nr:hypothetical protein [Candidatus Gracilibacteria bacterium]
MLFFGKPTEYEIMGQTYVEIMFVLNSKSTIEIEKIIEIEGYNVYFLSMIYAIVESGIIKSRFQLSKIKCNLFDVVDLVNKIYNSDFYNKNLHFTKENNVKFMEELSSFIYENLLLYYDKYLEKNTNYLPSDANKSKRIQLIKKGVEKAYNGVFPADAIGFVTKLTDNFYDYTQFREEKILKDLVIKYLENINQK